jgi:hypothetical protein
MANSDCLLKETGGLGELPLGLDVAFCTEGQVVDHQTDRCSQYLSGDPWSIPGALKERRPMAGRVAQVVECLPSKREALSSKKEEIERQLRGVTGTASPGHLSSRIQSHTGQ